MQQQMNDLLNWYNGIDVLRADEVKLDFAIAIERAMESEKISKADLARQLGTSSAWITKVLRGDANVTIETMCQLAEAVGRTLHIHLASNAASTVRWFDVIESGAIRQAAAHHVPAERTTVAQLLDDLADNLPHLGDDEFDDQDLIAATA